MDVVDGQRKNMKIESQILYSEQKINTRSPVHPAVRAFAVPKIKYIGKHIDLSKNPSVLDVGCGNGFFTYYLSALSDTVGLDYSRHLLALNPCSPLVQGSALSLPFKDNTFDIVICSNLLHHLEKPLSAVDEMKRISRRFVVMVEPNRNNILMALFSAIVPEERGALKFSLKYTERLAGLCKLKIIASCSMGSVVPNKMPLILLRWFEKMDCQNPMGFYNVVVSHK